jgi:hypothetical protein
LCFFFIQEAIDALLGKKERRGPGLVKNQRSKLKRVSRRSEKKQFSEPKRMEREVGNGVVREQNQNPSSGRETADLYVDHAPLGTSVGCLVDMVSKQRRRASHDGHGHGSCHGDPRGRRAGASLNQGEAVTMSPPFRGVWPVPLDEGDRID